VFAFQGELIDYGAVRKALKASPSLPAARLDRKARSLELATWSLLGLSGAGFVLSGAMYPATEGATSVLGFPAAAVPAVAALITGLEARRFRRLAADTFLRDDLSRKPLASVMLVPSVQVSATGMSVSVGGVF
jgi:hypothetical protein